jgi:hypothetical protein
MRLAGVEAESERGLCEKGLLSLISSYSYIMRIRFRCFHEKERASEEDNKNACHLFP